MRVELKDIDSCTRRIEIELPPEAVERELDGAYGRLNKSVRVQGFRRGKAPRRMLERLYSSEVERDVLLKLVNDSYLRVAEENKIDAVGHPKMDEVQLEHGKPLRFALTVEVLPEFELKGLEDMEFAKRLREVSDDDVEEELERLQEQHARYEAVDDPSVETDDLVILDLVELRDGAPVEEKREENFQLLLGRNQSLGRFEEQLLGMKRGEEKDILLSEDSPGEEGAQEGPTYRVKVNEIKKKRLPPIDDLFAKELGGFENLEELRRDARMRIEEMEEMRATVELRSEVLRRVVEENPIPVPESLLEEQTNQLLSRYAGQLKNAGVDLGKDTLEARKLRDDFRKEAEAQVREQLILDKIAAAEGLVVEEGELDEAIRDMAARSRQGFATVKESLTKSGSIENLRRRLLSSKAMDWIISTVRVRDEIAVESSSEEGDERHESEVQPHGSGDQPDQTAP